MGAIKNNHNYIVQIVTFFFFNGVSQDFILVFLLISLPKTYLVTYNNDYHKHNDYLCFQNMMSQRVCVQKYVIKSL